MLENSGSLPGKLGDALAVVRQPAARSELDAVDAVLLCFLNRPGEAITRARAVLASPHSDGAAVSWAVAALALSLAVALLFIIAASPVITAADAAARALLP